MKEERFEKVVEWERDNFGFLTSWLMVIFMAIFFLILYFQTQRKVYYKKVK